MGNYNEIDEAPLDPAQERLRRKMVRLLFVSGGIMMLGLIAVFAAIIYKLNEDSERRAAALSGPSATAPVTGRIAVPAGSRIVASALDGDRALITLETSSGEGQLLLIDLRDGTIIGRYEFAPDEGG